MKNSILRCLLALAVSLPLVACRDRETAAGGDATETIAPAQPQPETTGTEAMTQTVHVEDGRSEAEGAALTDTRYPTTTAPTTTTGTTATTPVTATAPTPTTTR